MERPAEFFRAGAGVTLIELEMHGEYASAPDVIEDEFSTLPNLVVPGTTAEIWSANPGWFTSAGDNTVQLQEGTLPSDEFFRPDTWTSFVFWCWLRYASTGLPFAVWAYGNDHAEGTTGGFGLSTSASDLVAIRANNGLGKTGASLGSSLQAAGDDVEHLVGGYLFRHEDVLYLQTFIDGVEQRMDSVPAGTWTTQPTSGFSLFGRSDDDGSVREPMRAGVQVRDLFLVKSDLDLRQACAGVMRSIYDFSQGPMDEGPQD